MNRNKFFTNGKLFDDGQCSICFSAPQIEKACPPCGHVFCCQCLTRWNKYRATCPICKNEFSKIAHINGKDQITSIRNTLVKQHIRCHYPSFFESELLYNIGIILSTGLICLGIWIAISEMYKLERTFNCLSTIWQRYGTIFNFPIAS